MRKLLFPLYHMSSLLQGVIYELMSWRSCSESISQPEAPDRICYIRMWGLAVSLQSHIFLWINIFMWITLPSHPLFLAVVYSEPHHTLCTCCLCTGPHAWPSTWKSTTGMVDLGDRTAFLPSVSRAGILWHLWFHIRVGSILPSWAICGSTAAWRVSAVILYRGTTLSETKIFWTI